MKQVVLLLLLATSAVASDGLTLQLYPSLTMTGPSIDIRQLGKVLGAEQQGRSLIIDLGSVQPKPGQSFWLPKSRLHTLFARQYPAINLSTIGADNIVLRTPGVELDQDVLKNSASSLLEELFYDQYKNLDITVAGSLSVTTISSPNYTLHPVRRNNGPLRSRESVTVVVKQGANVLANVDVWFRVQAELEAWITTTPLKAMSHLNLAQTEKATLDIGRVNGIPLDTIPTGQRLKRNLPAHSALTEKDIEPIPAVERGNRIEVLSQAGSVTIKTTAIAVSEGHKGALVAFQVKGADTLASGQVVGLNKVLVREDIIYEG